MNSIKATAQHAFVYVKAISRWLVISVTIGLLGGVLGTAFHTGVAYATGLRLSYPHIIWLLPVGGLAIVALYQVTHTEGEGTNAVIDAVHQGRNIPVLLIPAIFFGTILTHMLGGSAGREGAALQIGGDLGEHVGRFFRLDDKDTRLATLCGMSALFSALFGTPLTAAIFSLEVISVGVLYYAGLLPCLTAALTAYSVSLWLGVAPTRFALTAPALSLKLLILTALLALLCAQVSMLFCEAMHRTEDFAAARLPNRYARIFVGGLLLIALTHLSGCTDYNGAGMDIITAAVGGSAKPLAFAWKILFTAVTLGFGFRGGEVVPTFFVGAVFGCTAGALLGMPAGFAAALGLVAVFCGAVNCPIASILLSIELFGADGLLYFALACGVGYVLSGYRGLYSSQTILYSKLRAEFINVHTK